MTLKYNGKMKRNVFVFDSSYTLLVYCILFPNEINDTIYIHSNNAGLSNLNFNGRTHYTIKKGNTFLTKILSYIYFRIKIIFDPRLAKLVFYPNKYNFLGQDHLFFSGPFIHDFTLLEDGLANYNIIDRKGIYRILLGNNSFGRSKAVSRVLLSGMSDEIHESIINKVQYFELIESWINLSKPQKKDINDIFLYESNEQLDAETIILTQPLSEYGFISEENKIDIYSDIIKKYSSQKLIIRKHPREVTDYCKYFPELIVNESKIPIELLMLNSPKIKKAITVFSSSIFNLPCQEKIFLGTTFNPLLLSKFGRIDSVHLIK